MLGKYREEMICDLAETYRIFNYREVPVKTLGILVSGLRADSRVRMKQADLNVPLNTVLLAKLYDDFELYLWSMTKDGEHNRNRPESIADKLLDNDETDKDDYKGFDTPEELKKARAKIIEV